MRLKCSPICKRTIVHPYTSKHMDQYTQTGIHMHQYTPHPSDKAKATYGITIQMNQYPINQCQQVLDQVEARNSPDSISFPEI